MARRAVITASGIYLPPNIVTNDDLSKMVDTSDEWIQTRTGIKQRHKANDDEVTSDLAVHAAKQALDNAGLDINQIDEIIVATTTADRTFPATAVYVQEKLGMTRGAAYDVQAVCSGFIFGLTLANSQIVSGACDNVLLIGAETLFRLLDLTDRDTCVLFGDGAGAVVLQAQDGKGDMSDKGVLSHHIRSDGRMHDLLYTDGGPSYNREVGVIHMTGKEVFKHAVTNLSDSILAVLDKTGLKVSDIDWFVPHQANLRIISAVGKRIGLDESKVIVTVAQHANTSAASIPLAFHIAREDGRIKSGDLVMFEAMGAGFTWGSTLVRMP